MDVAKEVSKSLSERIVIAKVDGELWDLDRPLEKACKLELLDFEHPEGKKVFWHSSAHVLGEAAERHYGCHLCLGPPTDDGFFYEMAIEERCVWQFIFVDLVSHLVAAQSPTLIIPRWRRFLKQPSRRSRSLRG